MKSIFALLALSLFVLGCLPSGAAEVEIGSARLTIPAPASFEEVGGDTPVLLQFLKSIVGPQNSFLAAFVPPEKMKAAKATGAGVELVRYFSAQTMTSMRDKAVGAVQFAALRETLAKQNKQLFEQIKAEVPEVANAIKSKIKDDFDIDADVDFGAMIPLEQHYQTERAFAFSMLVSATVALEGEPAEEQKNAVTTTIVNINEKVLFLYSFGAKEDLQWTRDTGTAWAEDLLLANGISADLVAEPPRTKPESKWGNIWKRALIFGIIGGVVGAVIALVRKM